MMGLVVERHNFVTLNGVTIDYAKDGSVQLTIPAPRINQVATALTDGAKISTEGSELLWALEERRDQAIDYLKRRQKAEEAAARKSVD